MRVWHPVREVVRQASHCWSADTIEACFDGALPRSSGDHDLPRFTWWDHRGTAEWVRNDFDHPRTVSATEVYWFDDTGRGQCRVPESWGLEYLGEDGGWHPVEDATGLGTAPDQFNRAGFKPVTTRALRLTAQLQPGFSAGVLEWRTP
jgi:hypothetical protein